MKKIVVKYVEDEKFEGIVEVVERNEKKVFDEYDQSGDLYFSYEDMFKTEYEMLEIHFDEEEIEKIEIDFQRV